MLIGDSCNCFFFLNVTSAMTSEVGLLGRQIVTCQTSDHIQKTNCSASTEPIRIASGDITQDFYFSRKTKIPAQSRGGKQIPRRNSEDGGADFS